MPVPPTRVDAHPRSADDREATGAAVRCAPSVARAEEVPAR